MELEAITHRIIGCAYNVFKTLGYGFLESIYQRALLIELEKSGLKAESKRPMKVYYHDRVVGDFAIDILVEDEVVLELKSVEKLVMAHEV